MKTGRARSNWLANVGEPRPDQVDTLTPGQEFGPGSGGAVFESIAIASAVIHLAPDGDAFPIHLTNNVPYIQPLNDGSSAQAPAGYVQQAVAAGVDAIRDERILSGERE